MGSELLKKRYDISLIGLDIRQFFDIFKELAKETDKDNEDDGESNGDEFPSEEKFVLFFLIAFFDLSVFEN